MNVLDAYPIISETFCDVREEHGGQHVSCDCPIRNHSSSRLRFWLGDDGRLMFGCYACGPAAKLEILRAAGLSWKHCFPEGTKIERVHQECVDRYPYHDAAGKVLYQKLRWEPGRGGRDKEFTLHKPNPAFDPKRSASVDNKRWLRAGPLSELQLVLYRLPDLLRADPSEVVYVVAGEKDVNSLRSCGLLATTNVGGESEPWRDEYTAALAGRNVVVVEDADAAGRRHASEVCGALIESVASLRRVRLPAKDATAYLMGLRQNGINERAALRAGFLAAADTGRLWRAA